MPELPEVQTVVDELRLQIVDKTITAVNTRWPKTIGNMDPDLFKLTVINQKIVSLDRRGKYILIRLSNGTIIIHLRMEGRFFLNATDSDINKHTHVMLNLNNGVRLDYNDTRKFGRFYYYSLSESYYVLRNLGKEPFDADCTALYLHQATRRKKQVLKSFLLDQSTIAGIGNIYADEICYAVQCSPNQPVNRISLKKWEEIRSETIRILSEAIASGGSTIRTYTSSLGVSGRFQIELHAYGKGGCPCDRCGSEMKKIRVGQRGTVYCPQCQKVR